MAHLTTTGIIIAPTPINTVSNITIDVVQRLVATPAGDGATVNYRLDLCKMTSQNLDPSGYFRVDYSEAVWNTLTDDRDGPGYRVSSNRQRPAATRLQNESPGGRELG